MGLPISQVNVRDIASSKIGKDGFFAIFLFRFDS